MKFIRKLSLALVATLVLASNAFGVTSTLSKGKDINQFAELAQAKVKEREHKLAQEYANAYADNYKTMDQAEQQEALNQTKSFIEKAIKECKQSRIELVTDSIQAQLLGEIEEIVGDVAYQDLAKTLENAAQQKRATMTSEDVFKNLNECSDFFTANQSAEEQALMVPKLRLLIEHGIPLVKKEMSEIDFEEQFLEPVDLIIEKITDDAIYKDLSAKLETFMPEAPKIVEEQPSIAAKLLSGMMLLSVVVGGFNLLVKIQDPNMHPPSKTNQTETPTVADADISVEAVDLTEALEGTGNVTEIKVGKITSPAQDFATSVEEVVQVAEAEQPKPDLVKIDAIDLMKSHTINQTPAELAQNQTIAPRPGFFESVRALFSGFSPSFYDPVKHSGFDINTVEKTKQAESIIKLAEKITAGSSPSTIVETWNSIVEIFKTNTQSTIDAVNTLIVQVKSLITQKDNSIAEGNAEVVKLRAQVAKLEKEKADLQEENASKDKKIGQLEAKIKKVEAKVAQVEKENDDLKSNIAELEDSKKQLQEKLVATRELDSSWEKTLKEGLPLLDEFKDKIVVFKGDITKNADGQYQATIRTRSKWNPFDVFVDEEVRIFTPTEIHNAYELQKANIHNAGLNAHWWSDILVKTQEKVALTHEFVNSDVGSATLDAMQVVIVGAASLMGSSLEKVKHRIWIVSIGFNVFRRTLPLLMPVVFDAETQYYSKTPDLKPNEPGK